MAEHPTCHTAPEDETKTKVQRFDKKKGNKLVAPVFSEDEQQQTLISRFYVFILYVGLWAPIHSRTMPRHRAYMVDRHMLCDEKHKKFFPHLSVLVLETKAVGG